MVMLILMINDDKLHRVGNRYIHCNSDNLLTEKKSHPKSKSRENPRGSYPETL